MDKKSVETAKDTPGVEASRMSARGVLVRNIERSDRRTESLQLLVDIIPWNALSRKQEELLWNLFLGWG